MASPCVYEQKTVVHELSQGIEMAKQLRLNLNSAELRDFFIQKILSSYDNALFFLKSGQPRASPLPESSLPKSSTSTGSPQSGQLDFDQDFVSKKRKASTLWEDEVKIYDNELEGNTNDDYSWRKYGQKDILGAKFPRSYYRCSYSKAQKCMATKQVKRTDENPNLLEITYKGVHTCNHLAQSVPPPPPSPENQEIKPTHRHEPSSSPNSCEILSNLRANLTVDTFDLGATATLPSPFSFPSTPFEFSDDDFQPLNDLDIEELLKGYSPSFISPTTPESNYFTHWGTSPLLDLDSDFKFDDSLF